MFNMPSGERPTEQDSSPTIRGFASSLPQSGLPCSEPKSSDGGLRYRGATFEVRRLGLTTYRLGDLTSLSFRPS